MHCDTKFQQASFVRRTQSYDFQTSIHHWQLRDLVSAAENEDEFYCVRGKQIFLYNAKTSQAKVMMNLSYMPHSMTCRLGYLAAGGPNSQLEVRNLRTNYMCFKGPVGGTVNNALHVGKHTNGEMRLFVCNNDDTIKVFSLPSMTNVCTIRCLVPINYAALSPNGKHLVCVGDCQHTLLYEATPSGYTLQATFTEASDVGMCCAWSHYGNVFASAHQDGSVPVWDLRTGMLVAKYRCNRAARNVKFAKGPIDLLAVAEHQECVHLLDARKWEAVDDIKMQQMRPFRSTDDGLHISGMSFTPSSRRLWVAMADCCFSHDIDDRKRRTFAVKSGM
eukprot:jgi/Chrzof1/3997/Cz13g16160.t1